MGINRDRLIRDFSEMVATYSPSYGERTLGDRIKNSLACLGFSVSEDGAGSILGGNCGNIRGFLEGNLPLEPLLFCAHLDTVETSSGKRAVLGEDGFIRSGGDTILGSDDLSGVAAILEALRVIREEKLPHRPIEVLFSVAEEAYCRGIQAFDASVLRSKEAYVLDLSGPVGTAALRAPSIISYEAEVLGKSSHAGFAPEDGIHAVAAAAKAVAALPIGRPDEESTLNAGFISGGGATNIVPDRCIVRGEVRSYSHEKALEWIRAVGKRFEEAAAEYGAGIRFKHEVVSEAYQTPPDSPVVRRFEEAARSLGLPLSLISTFGGSDNNTLAKKGISGIVPACAMNEVHSLSEYTTVEELARAALLTLTLMTSTQ
ncbi:M20/M25/M40 family metallo-hydrolase [Papillibacter cinnamivorans]|uniref:Peptidase T-like protein n=1 Tax=Papillibacter cinnamivorans DSM 12816 TaxID=1122930 RepID=A0A1W2AUP8_9FIRM|nr:M20/M25/M40 family metallo-hydrolase [Papillibacter cinnamivorans]SMC64457.1 peptidase T-like protein [Papillibacter cinnamivorans DSM 12816]